MNDDGEARVGCMCDEEPMRDFLEAHENDEISYHSETEEPDETVESDADDRMFQ